MLIFNIHTMLIFNIDYIIYEFTYRLNSYVIPWKKTSVCNSVCNVDFSIDYITYGFTYRLNPYVTSWMQIRI